MAQLRIEQVQAPDFSASSQMMARANESFVSGIESAKGILGKYNEGQQAKDDLLAITEIAKQRDEAGLDGLLASDFFTGLNLSDTMRENLMNIRSDVIGNVNDRDSNSRANAGEGRQAAEYADGVAVRTERRGMTGAAVAAYNEGQQYGTGSAPAPSASDELSAAGGAEAIRYSNSGATRSQPLAEGLSGILSSVLPEMGLGFEVTSGGQDSADTPNARRVGDTTNHDHGNAGDGYFYDLQTGERIDPNTDPRAYEAVTRLTAAGVGGIGNGEGYMGDGMFHLGNTNGDRIWGADYSSGSADPRLAAAWEAGMAMRNGQQPPASGPSLNPVTENQMGGQSYQNFSEAVAASLYMDPTEAIGLLEGSLTSQRDGQARITAADQLRQTEVAAAGQTAAILNPNNLSQDAVTRQILTMPGVDPSVALGAAGQDRSAFAGVIAPAVAPDQQVTDALARIGTDEARTSGMDTNNQLFEKAAEFDNAENVGAALISDYEGSGMDAGRVNQSLESLARAAGVTVGEMATVIAGVAQGNVEQFNDMINAPADGDLYASMISGAERQFGSDARAARDASLAETSRGEAQRSAAELEYNTARTRAAKLTVGSPERAAADREVAELRDTVLRGMTPQQREENLRDYISKTGMASRLQGLDPESADFFRAMAQLEETIKADQSLTDNEKELLLRDVRG